MEMDIADQAAGCIQLQVRREKTTKKGTVKADTAASQLTETEIDSKKGSVKAVTTASQLTETGIGTKKGSVKAVTTASQLVETEIGTKKGAVKAVTTASQLTETGIGTKKGAVKAVTAASQLTETEIGTKKGSVKAVTAASQLVETVIGTNLTKKGSVKAVTTASQLTETGIGTKKGSVKAGTSASQLVETGIDTKKGAVKAVTAASQLTETEIGTKKGSVKAVTTASQLTETGIGTKKGSVKAGTSASQLVETGIDTKREAVKAVTTASQLVETGIDSKKGTVKAVTTASQLMETEIGTKREAVKADPAASQIDVADPAVQSLEGVSRWTSHPAECAVERAWLLCRQVPVPYPVPPDTPVMQRFGRLIWNHPAAATLPAYADASPKDLAALSCDRGRLKPCLVEWVAQRLNVQSQRAMSFCLPFLGPGTITLLRQRHARGELGAVTRLCFALSVGLDPRDGSVFIEDPGRAGGHWSVAIVDLDTGSVLYGDSLGGPLPVALMERIFPVLHVFRKDRAVWNVTLAHVPSAADAGAASPATSVSSSSSRGLAATSVSSSSPRGLAATSVSSSSPRGLAATSVSSPSSRGRAATSVSSSLSQGLAATSVSSSSSRGPAQPQVAAASVPATSVSSSSSRGRAATSVSSFSPRGLAATSVSSSSSREVAEPQVPTTAAASSPATSVSSSSSRGRAEPQVATTPAGPNLSSISSSSSPSSSARGHVCGAKCVSFPLQACGSACGGVLAVVAMAVSALSEGLFRQVCGPRWATPHWFLLRPSLYTAFLRRRVIRWFVSGRVDVGFASVLTCTSVPPTPHSVKPSRASCHHARHNASGTNSSAPNEKKKSATTTGLVASKRRNARTNSGAGGVSDSKKSRVNLGTDRADGMRGVQTPKAGARASTSLTTHKMGTRSRSGTSINTTPKPDRATSNQTSNQTSNENAPSSKPDVTSNLQETTATLATATKGTNTKIENTPKPRPKTLVTNKTPDPDTSKNTSKSGTAATTHETTPTPNPDGPDRNSQSYDQTKKDARQRPQCPYCLQFLAGRSALTYHLDTVHPDREDWRATSRGLYHRCNHCLDFKCQTVPEVCAHYRQSHGLNVRMQENHFPSMEDFLAWKKDVERETFSNFTKPRGTRKTLEYHTYYMNCNRMGRFRGKLSGASRFRNLKRQGSCKINATCTAFMTAYCSTQNGTVRVIYCTDHVGHEIEICHLRRFEGLKKKLGINNIKRKRGANAKNNVGDATEMCHPKRFKDRKKKRAVKNIKGKRDADRTDDVDDDTEICHLRRFEDRKNELTSKVTQEKRDADMLELQQLRDRLSSSLGELKGLVEQTQSTEALKAMLPYVDSALRVGWNSLGIPDHELK